MASSPDKLTPLQRDVLDAFFATETGFFLSGGSALSGFHLAHRTSDDLDLFTLDDEAFERGERVLADAAAKLTCRLESRQRSPGFRRYVLTRGDEAVVVDLVRERVPQLFGDKLVYGAVRVDPLPEILVNKLTALAGRSEIRDLVDVRAIEDAGLNVEDVLPAVLRKDGGATPAIIAWVLSEITIPDEARLPGDVKPADLRDYRDALVTRLRRAAAPPSSSA
jgi:predicted nucleotidyltransferase component of viral defense system